MNENTPDRRHTYFVLISMNGVGENTFDAPSVVGGEIFMSPILMTTSFTSLPNEAIFIYH